MAEASGQSFSALMRGFNELPPQRKFGLMVAVAAVIAIIIGSMMWAQAPDYRVLYGNLGDRDGGAVIESLQKQNIPYKMGEGGTILVPSAMVYEARLKLASEGLPKGGAVGFELMDNQKFGITQFQENVNYQRALEGEITRTIETISAVQGARVHLAIPKPTVFVRDQQKPSASVLVSLYSGRALDKAQVAGIVHLVASSVPEMPPGNVTIIDQNGNMLTQNGDKGAVLGLDSSQLEYLHQVEQGYMRRIESIISPITGPNNIRAQVTADLDFSFTEQTAEVYKPNPTPDQSSIRSQQTSETAGEGGPNAAGVPGALSNQPPGAATAPLNSPGGRTAAGANATTAAVVGPIHKESTTNYELDKTISHTKLPVGSVKRLSVAVVVNNKAIRDKKGKVTYLPLTKEELAQVYNLAKEAMGFNQARGDTLNVVNAPFNLAEGEEIASSPIWKDPAMQALAKDIVKYLVIAGLLMYLVLGVLKPMLSELSAIGNARMARAEGSGLGGAFSAADETGEVVTIGKKRAYSYEEDLQLVKDMAKQEPKIVANVVKDWVNKE
ncbi:MAG: flagellar basal-body MS-ring/collar protein FliF [Methylophilaceae bacterium]|jgi:flagellar M-ring protein FliF|nr:flagellar basal-body MS-ring/collar protein FliF [Methylophilaceae bacterium]